MKEKCTVGTLLGEFYYNSELSFCVLVDDLACFNLFMKFLHSFAAMMEMNLPRCDNIAGSWSLRSDEMKTVDWTRNARVIRKWNYSYITAGRKVQVLWFFVTSRSKDKKSIFFCCPWNLKKSQFISSQFIKNFYFRQRARKKESLFLQTLFKVTTWKKFYFNYRPTAQKARPVFKSLLPNWKFNV